jgi:hypothetical protein
MCGAGAGKPMLIRSNQTARIVGQSYGCLGGRRRKHRGGRDSGRQQGRYTHEYSPYALCLKSNINALKG